MQEFFLFHKFLPFFFDRLFVYYSIRDFVTSWLLSKSEIKMNISLLCWCFAVENMFFSCFISAVIGAIDSCLCTSYFSLFPCHANRMRAFIQYFNFHLFCIYAVVGLLFSAVYSHRHSHVFSKQRHLFCIHSGKKKNHFVQSRKSARINNTHHLYFCVIIFFLA